MPHLLIGTCRLILLSAGSISMDSTFKLCFPCQQSKNQLTFWIPYMNRRKLNIFIFCSSANHPDPGDGRCQRQQRHPSSYCGCFRNQRVQTGEAAAETIIERYCPARWIRLEVVSLDRSLLNGEARRFSANVARILTPILWEPFEESERLLVFNCQLGNKFRCRRREELYW